MHVSREFVVRHLFVAGVTLLVAAACEREEGRFREAPPAGTATSNVVMSELQPSPSVQTVRTERPHDGNAVALAEGRRLYHSEELRRLPRTRQRGEHRLAAHGGRTGPRVGPGEQLLDHPRGQT